jgi:hypothetical protein
MATASMSHGNAGQLPYLAPMIGGPHEWGRDALGGAGGCAAAHGRR